MTTSGTVGQTIVNTSKVIEHALRRCKFDVSRQTPEVVEIAKSCLYILLANYANSPLNLWCVERRLMGYQALKKEYVLPRGTTGVLNVLNATPAVAAGVLAGDTFSMPQLETILRIGISFSVLPTQDFTVEVSEDGLTFTPATSVRPVPDEVNQTGVRYWVELDPQVSAAYIRVSVGTLLEVLACTSVSEVSFDPLKRDSYAGLPNKQSVAERPTGYLFNKLIDPTLLFWPVPNNDSMHAVVWVHRQVQDVGRLTETLAIPTRWYDATIVQLAFRLALELPGVDDARIAILQSLAKEFTLDASSEETDSAPTSLQPRISAYTA